VRENPEAKAAGTADDCATPVHVAFRGSRYSHQTLMFRGASTFGVIMAQQGRYARTNSLRRSAVSQMAGWGQRRTLWGAVAGVLLVSGIASAVGAAGMVARAAGVNSQRAFRSRSAEIASTLQLAIQHEQDLIFSASAFVIGDPNASNAQFVAWARSEHALARYPELVGIGHSVIVPAAQLPAFSSHAVRDPSGPLAANGTLQVVPAGKRAFYCLSVGSLARTGTAAFPAGFDFCENGPTGAATRTSLKSGQGAYLPIKTGKVTLLSVLTPVYRDGRTPATVAGRRHSFLGWVGMSVAPDMVLARALQGHPGTGLTFRYHVGPWKAAFNSGKVPNGAQSATIPLHNGWTVETFGVVAGSGMFADPDALALLIAGVALSMLLAALVFVLGTGRVRALRMVSLRTGELRHQALHDGLTGLANRVLITDRIEQLLARNRRAGTEGAALFIDLDEFKNVNDTLGHDAGDQLLIAVAARLRSTLRDADTIGRMGGDEFVVLIDGGELSIAPYLVAERLLDVMRQPFELSHARTPLTVNTSIGIAIGDRADGGELLRDADVALYEAKAGGKNRYQVFHPEMQTTISHRMELEFDLRSALTDEQFFLVYQPIYNLDDLTVIGVEALLRWQHPTHGRMAPDEFIPILEQTGQIREVGRWVLNEACQQMVAWRSRGDNLDLSVNVSGVQLDSPAIVDHIRDALATTGLDPGALIIEVTETALMRDAEATARQLRAIKDLGVRIAVDDFGTGYSSLAYLQQFPVDSLKIDRMFTNAITVSPESKALIGTLVQLGRDLGLTTLAEGVETPRQLDHLRDNHVNEIQGFLLSRPLDAETLETEILAPTRPTTHATD
jgi:diguanylate cyclase (GGDEF)-like protein